jgi:RimJ/RimL family protein N-acetyltransferase
MYFAQGRFCPLEELTTENDKELFELMKNNKEEYRLLVSDEPVPETYEEFQNRLNIWFTHGRNYQFLVKKKDNKTVGTIFFYGLDSESKSVKLSVYFIPEVRKTSLIGEALGLILNFALEILKVEKVEFSVYKENEEMLRILEKGKIKRYIKERGESKSTVNPERTIINFEINLESLREIDERLKEFCKPRR